ncbi:MAG: hypothetical protein OMM_07240 [Candidatus Magnetoglobus multicellularis str. Araruama]|uniref:Uncharacterized protein n=1 Tax=Candidatus Magnetoglobus multicellularis str. Araruama TaxID=890399 RepID=A0A1V1PDR9_9BACT|nr:MAG: hypothetical protein OMM_07240 [Candidatus Magnetoglobus multicellularis str. Araruama]
MLTMLLSTGSIKISQKRTGGYIACSSSKRLLDKYAPAREHAYSDNTGSVLVIKNQEQLITFLANIARGAIQ